MKKLSVKDIIGFRNKSERSKKTFALGLKLYKEKEKTDGGGNYWVRSLSAIGNAFKGDKKAIANKIEEIEEILETEDRDREIQKFQRNIRIMRNYQNINFKKWWISKEMIFLKRPPINSILTFKDLQIKAISKEVFVFKKEDSEEIGAIWFVASLGGYKNDELGMFTDVLHKYLKVHFGKKYVVNPNYCMAVDLVNCIEVNYYQIQKAEVSALLAKTIDEIKKLMR